MANVVVQLPADLSGTNPNNLVGNEEHLLVSYDGFPRKIITLFHGGFYADSLKVYDQNYNKLIRGVDFICTYKHQGLSDRVGMDVCSAIIFIDPARTGIVYTSAQMVGADLAFSFTVIADYITFYKSKPPFVPTENDYKGTEPTWGPGELVQNRWHLDTYQPFNNELENISRRILIGPETKEDDFRQSVRDRVDQFLARFNNRLDNHLADMANPHVVNKADLLLGLVRNLPLATTAQAQAGTDNATYLTPGLVWSGVDKLATEPLTAHTGANPANPHGLTNVQLNAPTKATVDQVANAKYNRNETVANATYAILNGSWTTYDNYVYEMRRNLDTSFFPLGQLNPGQMGSGPLSATTVYRGDGTWVDMANLMAEFGGGGGMTLGTVRVMASAGNDPYATLNQIRAWYPSDPDGSMVFVDFLQTMHQGYGNGGETFDVAVRGSYIKLYGSWTYI